MQSQKEAVFVAITGVLASEGIKFEAGQNAAPFMSKTVRESVSNELVSGFQNGTIELSKTYTEETKLRAYVGGLISNWIRKDNRLNGGIKYAPKNPGSRAGSGDVTLTNLRRLQKSLTTDADKAEVQVHIDQRLSELNTAKMPAIDFSALPAELQAKFAQ